MRFDEKLVSLRKKHGMSQEELAEKLNVSRQAISRWEMGSTMPDIPNLLQLCDLFGVSADYLIHDERDMDGNVPAERKLNEDAEEQFQARKIWKIGYYFGLMIMSYILLAIYGLFFVAGGDLIYVGLCIGHIVSAAVFTFLYFNVRK